MAKVTFNGETKLITVITGTTDIDVELDLYSEWKNWINLADNAKYLHAFRTFGGDATNAEETQFAPKFFFLMNGWKIMVNGDNIQVQLNLYIDGGGSPFIVNNGSVVSKISDANVIGGAGGLTSEEHTKLMSVPEAQTNADTLLNSIALNYNTIGSLGELLNEIRKITKNKVVAIGDVIDVYEEDGTTIWKTFNLSNGGRIEL